MIVLVACFRGGGGFGKKWHNDGRRTKKHNSINDYISCAKFLIEKDIVHENKLAGWGYSAGGLLVASAINRSPDLFRAAVLKVLKNVCVLSGFGLLRLHFKCVISNTQILSCMFYSVGSLFRCNKHSSVSHLATYSC